jgi:hypothetical protein
VIDGVMGFTSGGKEDVFSQLVASNKCDNVWSICMHEGSKSNGSITIGGVDPRLSSNVQYVADSGFGFHSVQVTSITIGGSAPMPVSDDVARARAPIPVGASAILDTGTNILLVPSSVLAKVSAAICADSSLASCSDLFKVICTVNVPLRCNALHCLAWSCLA